ncbi:hypothetical protein [Arcobacter sp. FWKO B]|uniref:hypothetical protein n=1 Tax=Arcobacter sp. FWKO B TaxID=2593672 RepID=UPI0018A5F059|nr:hypothetical protein [Arcobacter sp. FWKO B]QOG11231.1 hypothetical protein FWKOB_00355 [Arcobacter sp. FWKO B]
MIGISNKQIATITKYAVMIAAFYIVSFIFVQGFKYIKYMKEENSLKSELNLKLQESQNIKMEIQIIQDKLANVQNSYISQEELEERVIAIFERMSVFDFHLRYIGATKLCIDRYVLMVQLSARSEEGLKAAEGILSYLGQTQKSQDSDVIYYIDYISSMRE